MASGAISFLISDSLLAIHKFKTPVRLRDYLVWVTDYAGQCGIALRGRAQAESVPHGCGILRRDRYGDRIFRRIDYGCGTLGY